MIARTLEERLRQLATWFPVVSLTGPRQSGKSTLVKAAFPDYEYVTLEDPSVRRAALDDPVGFIRNRGDHIVIDEAQYAPELFSMIQVVSDERNTTGQYVLTGSQNFLMLKQIGQSLAGRVGILRLLPLSYAEVQGSERASSPDAYMLTGGYPRLYDVPIDLATYFDGYVSTYVERDVRDLLDVRNLASFDVFLRLCAQRAGALLNVSELAKDVGINFRTARSWLSILESSYICYLLRPYSSNPGKRLVKSPKLYFYDTGLLCHLLGITDVRALLTGDSLGNVFENLVVSETLKHYMNRGVTPDLYFYRDDGKREVDLVDLTPAQEPVALEVKSTQTFQSSLAGKLVAVSDELGIPAGRRHVVYRGDEAVSLGGCDFLPAGRYLPSL